jgi:hypothetical protein
MLQQLPRGAAAPRSRAGALGAAPRRASVAAAR